MSIPRNLRYGCFFPVHLLFRHILRCNGLGSPEPISRVWRATVSTSSTQPFLALFAVPLIGTSDSFFLKLLFSSPPWCNVFSWAGVPAVVKVFEASIGLNAVLPVRFLIVVLGYFLSHFPTNFGFVLMRCLMLADMPFYLSFPCI